MIRKRRLTASMCLFLMIVLAPRVWAQHDPPARAPVQGNQDLLLERIGVDLSRERPTTLNEVILMALQNNHDIEIERINGQVAGFQLTASRGVYDPVFTSTLSYETANLPTASVLTGGAEGSLRSRTFVYNFTLQQQLPTGGLYSISLDNNRLYSSNVFISLNPQYNNRLALTFRQPLWRNMEVDANRRLINISKKQLDLSDSEFRRRVIDIINRVQKAYWDLLFARRYVKVQQDAVDLSQRQLAINQRMVEAGSLAAVEIVAAVAEVKRREEMLLTAVEVVTLAENVLKGLILVDRTDPLWNQALIPTESTEIQSVPLSLEEAVRLALNSRPEIEELRLQSEINDVDIGYYRNQSRPQIDFVGSYYAHGLAGKVRSEDNPFSSANQLLSDRVNLLSELAGLPALDGAPQAQFPQFLVGGAGQGFSNLFSNDFRTVQVGVSISLPIRNRTAQARVGQALAEQRLIHTQRQRMEQAIEVEVRNTLQAVETSRKRIEATRAARLAAEANLASEERRYEVGETTNFLVLTRQNELSASQSQELRALLDYNKAIAELQRSTATTLNAFDVHIDVSQGHDGQKDSAPGGSK